MFSILRRVLPMNSVCELRSRQQRVEQTDPQTFQVRIGCDCARCMEARGLGRYTIQLPDSMPSGEVDGLRP